MTSPKDLVAAVSRRLGVPLETVTVIDRLLAEAGLRTRALRGRGKTSATFRDAANLMVATVASARPIDSVAVCLQHDADVAAVERELRSSSERCVLFITTQVTPCFAKTLHIVPRAVTEGLSFAEEAS